MLRFALAECSSLPGFEGEFESVVFQVIVGFDVGNGGPTCVGVDHMATSYGIKKTTSKGKAEFYLIRFILCVARIQDYN